jgi:homoserine O-acetyltransferase
VTDYPGPVSRHLRTMRLFPAARPLRLECGGELSGIQVGYEIYGPADGETVFVCHALTGDAHVAAHDRRDSPGWWDCMVGPGRPVDTDRFRVICANVLGGCAGTTGPWSPVGGGRRLGAAFPDVSVADMVGVHRALLAELGIRRLHAVIGGSLGGMQVLHWLLAHPREARMFLPIATSARLSADNLAFNAVARAAIHADPLFAGGHYRPDATPDTGLGIARMVGHLTYLSPQSLNAKCAGPDTARSVQRYLDHQARKLTRRFDANTYLRLTAAMDTFDPFGAPPPARAGVPAPAVHLFSFATDRLFGVEHSRSIRSALADRGIAATHYHDGSSQIGHDAFLLDVPGYLREVDRHLSSAPAERRAAPPIGAPVS